MDQFRLALLFLVVLLCIHPIYLSKDLINSTIDTKTLPNNTFSGWQVFLGKANQELYNLGHETSIYPSKLFNTSTNKAGLTIEIARVNLDRLKARDIFLATAKIHKSSDGHFKFQSFVFSASPATLEQITKVILEKYRQKILLLGVVTLHNQFGISSLSIFFFPLTNPKEITEMLSELDQYGKHECRPGKLIYSLSSRLVYSNFELELYPDRNLSIAHTTRLSDASIECSANLHTICNFERLHVLLAILLPPNLLQSTNNNDAPTMELVGTSLSIMFNRIDGPRSFGQHIFNIVAIEVSNDALISVLSKLVSLVESTNTNSQTFCNIQVGYHFDQLYGLNIIYRVGRETTTIELFYPNSVNFFTYLINNNYWISLGQRLFAQLQFELYYLSAGATSPTSIPTSNNRYIGHVKFSEETIEFGITVIQNVEVLENIARQIMKSNKACHCILSAESFNLDKIQKHTPTMNIQYRYLVKDAGEFSILIRGIYFAYKFIFSKPMCELQRDVEYFKIEFPNKNQPSHACISISSKKRSRVTAGLVSSFQKTMVLMLSMMGVPQIALNQLDVIIVDSSQKHVALSKESKTEPDVQMYPRFYSYLPICSSEVVDAMFEPTDINVISRKIWTWHMRSKARADPKQAFQQLHHFESFKNLCIRKRLPLLAGTQLALWRISSISSFGNAGAVREIMFVVLNSDSEAVFQYLADICYGTLRWKLELWKSIDGFHVDIMDPFHIKFVLRLRVDKHQANQFRNAEDQLNYDFKQILKINNVVFDWLPQATCITFESTSSLIMKPSTWEIQYTSDTSDDENQYSVESRRLIASITDLQSLGALDLLLTRPSDFRSKYEINQISHFLPLQIGHPILLINNVTMREVKELLGYLLSQRNDYASFISRLQLHGTMLGICGEESKPQSMQKLVTAVITLLTLAAFRLENFVDQIEGHKIPRPFLVVQNSYGRNYRIEMKEGLSMNKLYDNCERYAEMPLFDWLGQESHLSLIFPDADSTFLTLNKEFQVICELYEIDKYKKSGRLIVSELFQDIFGIIWDEKAPMFKFLPMLRQLTIAYSRNSVTPILQLRWYFTNKLYNSSKDILAFTDALKLYIMGVGYKSGRIMVFRSVDHDRVSMAHLLKLEYDPDVVARVHINRNMEAETIWRKKIVEMREYQQSWSFYAQLQGSSQIQCIDNLAKEYRFEVLGDKYFFTFPFDHLVIVNTNQIDSSAPMAWQNAAYIMKVSVELDLADKAWKILWGLVIESELMDLIKAVKLEYPSETFSGYKFSLYVESLGLVESGLWATFASATDKQFRIEKNVHNTIDAVEGSKDGTTLAKRGVRVFLKDCLNEQTFGLGTIDGFENITNFKVPLSNDSQFSFVFEDVECSDKKVANIAVVRCSRDIDMISILQLTVFAPHNQIKFPISWISVRNREDILFVELAFTEHIHSSLKKIIKLNIENTLAQSMLSSAEKSGGQFPAANTLQPTLLDGKQEIKSKFVVKYQEDLQFVVWSNVQEGPDALVAQMSNLDGKEAICLRAVYQISPGEEFRLPPDTIIKEGIKFGSDYGVIQIGLKRDMVNFEVEWTWILNASSSCRLGEIFKAFQKFCCLQGMPALQMTRDGLTGHMVVLKGNEKFYSYETRESILVDAWIMIDEELLRSLSISWKSLYKVFVERGTDKHDIEINKSDQPPCLTETKNDQSPCIMDTNNSRSSCTIETTEYRLSNEKTESSKIQNYIAETDRQDKIDREMELMSQSNMAHKMEQKWKFSVAECNGRGKMEFLHASTLAVHGISEIGDLHSLELLYTRSLPKLTDGECLIVDRPAAKKGGIAETWRSRQLTLCKENEERWKRLLYLVLMTERLEFKNISKLVKIMQKSHFQVQVEFVAEADYKSGSKILETLLN